MNIEKAYNIDQILREMREEYWRGIEETTQAEETRDYLVFRLGGEAFAMPTAAAREVLRLPKVVRVPRLPETIRGVINLRGQIMAVTDLRPLLGLPDAEIAADARLIVAGTAEFSTALLTEGVEGIRSLPLAAIEPLTHGLSSFPREAAAGQVDVNGGFLILLDMDHLLARPELVIDGGGE